MNEHRAKPRDGGQLGEPQRPSIAGREQEAQFYEHRHAAGVLAVLGKGASKQISPAGFTTYIQNVLAKATDPDDPLQRMMTEQLAFLHRRIGDLHMAAAAATTPEMVNALNAAVSKLSAEFRKSTMALRELRHPMPPQQVTLIKQQNLAAGDQQIAIVDSAATAATAGKTILDSEVGSNRPHRLAHELQPQFTAESEASRRGQAEPVEASRPDARRATAPTRDRFREQALDVLNGSPNRAR